MNRTLISIGIGLLLIIGGWLGAKAIIDAKPQRKATPKNVTKTVFVDTLSNGKVPIIFKANGTIRAKDRISLFSEVQGVFRYSSQAFRPGVNFNKGSLLIGIDNQEFRASLLASKSQLFNQLATILPDLQLDFPDVFPKWKAYVDAFDVNKTLVRLPDFSNEREKYFINGRGILNSYYNIKNQEERLTKFNLIAPFNGILTEANITQGSLISPGQKLGEFINPELYELEVVVPSTYANNLVIGKKVNLNDLGSKQEYEGILTRVNPVIDPTTRMITAFVEIRDTRLKEGQFIEATLKADDMNDAIELNRALVLEDNSVYAIKDSVLTKIPVEPQHYTESTVVVTGIPDKTPLLAKPLLGAYEGMRVKPINSQ